MGGGSPIDAAKAMWIKYEYPDTSFDIAIGMPDVEMVKIKQYKGKVN